MRRPDLGAAFVDEVKRDLNESAAGGFNFSLPKGPAELEALEN
jgi:hypothetical protein